VEIEWSRKLTPAPRRLPFDLARRIFPPLPFGVKLKKPRDFQRLSALNQEGVQARKKTRRQANRGSAAIEPSPGESSSRPSED